MKKIFLLLPVALAVTLAACSAPETPDQILSGVHERYIGGLINQLEKIQVPAVQKSDFHFVLGTASGQKLVPVNGTFDVKASDTVDTSDNTNTKIDGQLLADLKADIPTALMGMLGKLPQTATASQAPMQSIHGAYGMNIRLLNHKFFVEILNAELSSASSLLDLSLGAALKNTWFGATADELNAMVNKNNTAGNLIKLDRLFGGQRALTETYKQKIIAYLKTVALFDVTQKLDDKDGAYQVKIELNKTKLIAAVNGLLDLGLEMQKTTATPEELAALTKQVEASKADATKKINDQLGTVNGILLVDKHSHEILGLDLDVYPKDKTEKSGTISYLKTGGDISLSITNPTTPGKGLAFALKDGAYTLTVDGQPVASGTATKKKFTANVVSSSTQVLAADFDIAKFEETGFEAAGKIDLLTQGVELLIGKISLASSNSYKNSSAELQAGIVYQNQRVVDMSVTSSRVEATASAIDEPSPVQPLQKLIDGLNALGAAAKKKQ